MIRVKVCGITNVLDAQRAAKLGAWALGFIFYKKSPRSISPFKAKKIIESLPPFVTPVGVFVNAKEGAIRDIAKFCGINVLQLHGDETPAFCRRLKGFRLIKAFRVKDKIGVSDLKPYPVDAFLFDAFQKDAHGGTGETFDWGRIKGVKDAGIPVILSGGLNVGNIRQAWEEVRPYALDVSSSLEEAPGKKDERRMKDFFQEIRNLLYL